MTIKISLILATVGRKDDLMIFFNSLRGTGFSDYEVIVVDQNDDDRLVPIVQTMLASGMDIVHLRAHEKSLSKARNLGLGVAKYDLIGFPDDDCWYGAGLIEQLKQRMAQDANMDGVMVHWEEQLQNPPVERILSFARLIRFREVPVASITLFLKKSCIAKIGEFDHRFGVKQYFGASEETDFILRALKQGAKIVFAPEIKVHHKWGGAAHAGYGLEHMKRDFRSSRSRARGTGAIYAKHVAPSYIVLRGCLAPLARFALSIHKPRHAAIELGTAVGRLQGYFSWKRLY